MVLNHTESGFCDFEQTPGILGSYYDWPETESSTEASVQCPFVPNGMARRNCSNGTGEWEEPNTDECDSE